MQATDIIQAQKAFYGLDTPVGYQILLALTMQLFGLGLAGLSYKFIVEPPHMVSSNASEHVNILKLTNVTHAFIKTSFKSQHVFQEDKALADNFADLAINFGKRSIISNIT